MSDDRQRGIGVVAPRSLFSLKSLRRYEQLSRLCPAGRLHPGKRRDIEPQLEDARLLIRLTRLDMPLATVADLDPRVPTTIGRHCRTVERFGGVSGLVLVIFHSQMNEDSDGPVEVCAPITPAAEQRGDLPFVATRTEPAHRGARTRITKAMEFPQILAAYDAPRTTPSPPGSSSSTRPSSAPPAGSTSPT